MQNFRFKKKDVTLFHSSCPIEAVHNKRIDQVKYLD